MNTIQFHEKFMREALKEASVALEEKEVPVGAVIVHDGVMIARAHNQRERLIDPTAHAEMIALTQAATALENWRLDEATLYVTIEPCLMCLGALIQARVPMVVYGAKNTREGACGSVHTVRAASHPQIECGVLESECGTLMSKFFKQRRGQIGPTRKS